MEEGLDHFAGEAYAGVTLDVDLKLPGYEQEVVDGLGARTCRALARVLHVPESLDALGELRPGFAGAGPSPGAPRLHPPWLAVPAYAAVRVMRARLPGQAARGSLRVAARRSW